ncbi:DUF4214 domain-containing protein, partial [Duganella guangzhouensis]
MVAIVSGNNNGLLNSSAGVLGQQGLLGNALHGSSQEGVFVNIATGNLSLQDQDGFLAAAGINLALTRTYNSQAIFSDSSNKGWQNPLVKQLQLIGNLNDSSSYIQRIDVDGSVSVFNYKSDGVYVSTDGGGGFQTLTAGTGSNLGQWTWTNDRTDLLGPYEVYDMNQGGYIVKAGDQVGVRVTYLYNKLATSPATYQLSKVTDAAGDTVSFAYTVVSGLNRVTVTITPPTADGTAYAVIYDYDAQNRLRSAAVDLTPLDNKNNTVYTTKYSYGEDSGGVPSRLVTGISQDDGTRLTFTYKDGRLEKYTVYASATDNVGNTTSFNYGADRTTTVTDALQHQVVYKYDSKGQLTEVRSSSGTVTYTYDSGQSNGKNVEGNVLSMTDARGMKTVYEYDSNGNRTKQSDSAGNTIVWTYAAGSNLLLSTTSYNDSTLSTPATTRYVYDKFNRLRFKVSPEGRVTEYLYLNLTAANEIQYSSVRMFTAATYSLPADSATLIDLDSLAQWSVQQVKSKLNYTQTNYTYVRGLVKQATTVDNDSATPASTTTYTYFANGQVATETDLLNNKTSYTYDGLGRLLTKTVSDASNKIISSAASSYSASNHVVTEVLYDTRGGTAVAFASNIYTFDGAGRLLNVAKSGVYGVTTNSYDADGQLRYSLAASGQYNYWLYDDVGNQVASIDDSGHLTELIYNQNGQVIQTIRYDTALSAQQLSTLRTLKDGNVADAKLADFRPTEKPPAARRSWNFYDNAGRLIDSVDTAGAITHYEYDAASRLLASTLRATNLSPDALKDLIKTSVDSLLAMTGIEQTSSPNDRSLRRLYDKDGLLVGQIDALGYLTEYRYNAAGFLVKTTAYATKSKQSTTYALDSIRPNQDAARDVTEYRLYDAQNRLVGIVDGDGYLTELAYDTAGRIQTRTRYANKTTAPEAVKLADVKAKITSPTSTDNRVVSYTYDALDRVLTETNTFFVNGTSTSWITTYAYDPNGKLSKVEHDNGGTSVSKTYDTEGRVLTETAGIGAPSTVYAYDANGNLIKKTAPDKSSTLYYYDSDDRLVYTLDAAGQIQQLSYNNYGQVTTTRSYATALDTVTLAGLTGGLATKEIADLLKKSSGDKDHVNLFSYDDAGRLVYTVGADGQVDQRLYNDFSEQKATVHYDVSVGTGVLLGDYAVAFAAVQTLIKNATWRQTSSTEYDAAGRVTYTVNGAGNAQRTAYDGLGNVSDVTQYDPLTQNRALHYEYNKRGQVIDYKDALGNHTLTTYNGFGEAIMRSVLATEGSTTTSAALDSVSRIIYDENGRVAATIDALRVVTFYQYNGDGKVIDQTTYSTPLTASQLTTLDTQLQKASNTSASSPLPETLRGMLVAAATTDAHQQFVYDARGRLTITYTAKASSKWSVTTQTYDDNDNVTSRVSYANLVSVANPRAASTLPAASVSDVRVRMSYDIAGRLTDTLTALNTVGKDGNPIQAPATGSTTNWSLVSLRYDSFGNVLQRTAYAQALSVATDTLTLLDTAAPSAKDVAALKNVAAQNNVTTVYTYNSANRVTYSASAQSTTAAGKIRWAVTGYEYDTAGRLKTSTEFANWSELAPGTSPLATENPLPTADASRDRATNYTYDGAGRLQTSTDAAGGVTTLNYDARGNVIKRTQSSPAQGEVDRVAFTVYDLNNRPLYQIDGLGDVTRNTYDALGNLITVTQYATRIDIGKLATTTVDKLVKTTVNDRIEHYIYDQDGQRRFVLDAGGYLSQQTYDAVGRALISTTYAIAVGSKFVSITDYTVEKAISLLSLAGTAHVTNRSYDAQGNLSTVTDPEGFSESYTYDALGNKLSYKNQLSNEWKYTYDAGGRMLSTTAPAVMVYANGATKTDSGKSLNLVTLQSYDALGNMISRSEGGGSGTTHTTSYGYDLQGRQITTILPENTVYDGNVSADADGRTEAKVKRTINVSYDALGNAVESLDSGNTSFKVYDKLGRVLYDIDALGFVTAYARNGFGEVTTLTRYAKQLDETTLGRLKATHSLSTPTSSPDDRSITTSYDALGRVRTVSEPAVTIYDQQSGTTRQSARVTETEYNVFGEVFRKSVYGKSGATTTAAAVTRSYYDARGYQVAQITALSDKEPLSGYLTTYEFDAEGNQKRVKEYASVVSGWTDSSYGSTPSTSNADRETTYEYDGNGRKTQETQLGALRNGDAASDIKRIYKYDATGNQTYSQIEGGTATITYFDAFGRTTAVAQLAQAGDTTVMPASEFRLDAYGNIIVRVDYASGAATTLKGTIGTQVDTFKAPTADGVKDRYTISKYDAAGHATEVTDAENVKSFLSYDAFGRLKKQWKTVSSTYGTSSITETAYQLNEYDSVGHLVNVKTPGNRDLIKVDVNALLTDPVAISKTMAYNAYGEVISVIITDGTTSRKEYTDYDLAGQIWRTNSGDGVIKLTLFDAQGKPTVQMRSSQASDDPRLQNLVYANLADVLTMGGMQRLDTRYDLLGHALDEGTMHGNDLYFMVRQADGSWVKQTMADGGTMKDGLLVIGDRSDKEATSSYSGNDTVQITVFYKKLNDKDWLSTTQRVSWVDGYPVLNTSGLESGQYEYRVQVKPKLEDPYYRSGGVLQINSTSSDEKAKQLIRLYLLILGRAPDAEGLSAWMAAANAGSTMATIAADMLSQAPRDTLHKQFDSGLSSTQVLQAIYRNRFPGKDLNDPAVAAELAAWAARMDLKSLTIGNNAGQALSDLAAAADTANTLQRQVDALYNYLIKEGGLDYDTSRQLLAEADDTSIDTLKKGSDTAQTQRRDQQLALLYVALYGRAADKEGFDWWTKNAPAPRTIASIATDFLNGDEWKNLQSYAGMSDSQVNQLLINRVYTNLVGHQPDATQLSTWLDKLNSGSITRGEFVVQATDAIARNLSGDSQAIKDRNYLQEQLVVSMTYAHMDGVSSDVSTVIAVGRALISGITPDTKLANLVSQVKLYIQAQKSSASGFTGAASAGAQATPMETHQLQLAQLYVAIYNRAPNVQDFRLWLNSLNTGNPLQAVAKGMLDSSEGLKLYPATLSDSAFIDQVYSTAFTGTPDARSKDIWLKALQNQSRSVVLLDIISDTLYATTEAGKPGRDLFNAKVGVGLTYALNATGNDIDLAKTINSLVTINPVSKSVTISAAMDKISQVAKQLATADALTTAQAASNAANLVSATLAAAISLSPANASAATKADIVAKTPMAAAALRAAQLYVAMLNRGITGIDKLDLGGFLNQTQALYNGTSDVVAAQAMLNSDEGTALFPLTMTGRDFVIKFYSLLTGGHEIPNPADLDAWIAKASNRTMFGATAVAMLDDLVSSNAINDATGNDLLLKDRATFDRNLATLLSQLSSDASQAALAASAVLSAVQDAQSKAAAASTAATAVTGSIAAAAGTNEKYVLEIARLYVGILNRGAGSGETPIDYEGFTYWLRVDKEKVDTLYGIATGMLLSTDGQKIFGGLSDDAFIAKLYQKFFNRQPTAQDTYWPDRLKSGTPRGQLLAEMITSMLDTVYPLPSEYDAASAFNQRVSLALSNFYNAPATATAISQAATDYSNANTSFNNASATLQAKQAALDTANSAKPQSYPAVIAAQQAINYLNSPYLTDLINLRVALRLPTDYNTIAADLDALAAGTRKLTDIAASINLSITDRAAFYSALFSRILNRQDADGQAWWATNSVKPEDARYSDPGFLVWDFVQSCFAELNGTQSAYPMRVRNNFPTEISSVTTQNRNIATPLAASYNTALQNANNDIAQRRSTAQQEYNTALTAYNNANTTLQQKKSLNDYARLMMTSLSMTIAVVNNQDKAAAAMASKLRADDTLKAAQASLASLKSVKDNGISTMTIDQLVTFANIAVNVGKSINPLYDLNYALANVADASVAMALSAKNTAAASTAAQNVLQTVQVYALLLNRAPTLTELNLALAALASGQTMDSYVNDLIAANTAAFPAGLSNDDFVRQLYLSFRSSPPDDTGLRFWSGTLSGAQAVTRGKLVTNLINSLYKETINPDAISFDTNVSRNLAAVSKLAQTAAVNPDVIAFISVIATTLRNQAVKTDAAAQAALTPSARAALRVTQLYVMLLGRVPDPSTLMSRIAQLTSDQTINELAQTLLNSAEISGRLPSTLSNSQFVQSFYQLALYRQPDATELSNLTTQLDNGQLSRAQLVLDAIDGAYNYTGGDLAKLEARNMLVGRLSTAMDAVADTMSNYSQVMSSGFSTTVETQLGVEMKKYVSIAAGINSTTTETSPRLSETLGLQVDRWGNVTKRLDVRDPNWNTTYEYDDNNQLIATSRQAMAQDANGNYAMQTLTTKTNFDARGNVLSTTDAKGYINKYGYDANGSLKTETHADYTTSASATASIVYLNDAFGQHLTVTQYLNTSANAVKTIYTYDNLGRLATRSTASVTVYYYNGSIENNAAGVSKDTYSYDALGRRTSVKTSNTTTVDPNGNYTTYTRYDLNGNIIGTIDASGVETLTAYDLFNHKIKETVVDSGSTPQRLVKQWGVSTFGQVQYYIGLDGSRTLYNYDAAGQLTRQYIDTRGVDTPADQALQDLRYTYEDGTGLLLSIDDRALHQLTTYSYDRAGNRLTEKVWLQEQNRAAQDQILRYDGFNRLTDIVSATAGADYNVHYKYDLNGNRTSESTAYTSDNGQKKVVTVNYDYDKMNRQ